MLKHTAPLIRALKGPRPSSISVLLVVANATSQFTSRVSKAYTQVPRTQHPNTRTECVWPTAQFQPLVVVDELNVRTRKNYIGVALGA